jgi:hypothetical protein
VPPRYFFVSASAWCQPDAAHLEGGTARVTRLLEREQLFEKRRQHAEGLLGCGSVRKKALMAQHQRDARARHVQQTYRYRNALEREGGNVP